MKLLCVTLCVVLICGCTSIDYGPPEASRGNIQLLEHEWLTFDENESSSKHLDSQAAGEQDDLANSGMEIRRVADGVYAIGMRNTLEGVLTERDSQNDDDEEAAEMPLIESGGIHILDTFQAGDQIYAFYRDSTPNQPWRTRLFLGRILHASGVLTLEMFDRSAMEEAAKSAGVKTTRIAYWGIGLRVKSTSSDDTLRFLAALSNAEPNDRLVWRNERERGDASL